MERELIIRMARESVLDHYLTVRDFPKQLERFASLVAAHEREACAKVCDDIGDSDNGYGCAAAIRARGEK